MSRALTVTRPIVVSPGETAGSSPRRLRRIEFVQAHELTKRSSLSYDRGWGSGDQIERLAEDYKHGIENRGIVLRNKKNDTIRAFPFKTRFSSEYYPNQARKIRQKTNFETALFLTLTLDPKLFTSLFGAYYGLKQAWRVLSRDMQREIMRGGSNCVGWDGRYMLVVEFQKSGSPHLHIILAGCRWLDANWVRDRWHVGTFVKIEAVKSNRSRVVGYIAKYLTKSQVNFSHIAYLWALNGRAFSSSRGIFNQENSLTNCVSLESEWEYLGVVDWAVCKDWESFGDFLTYSCGRG